VYAPALNFLNTDPESNTEFLARKIIVNAKAGNDVTALVNALVALFSGAYAWLKDRLDVMTRGLISTGAQIAMASGYSADEDVDHMFQWQLSPKV
jgi:hypothetical protein